MFLFVVQSTILSIIFIYITHSLFLYFRDTMTVPKIKDLVNAPSKQYMDMYGIISKSKAYDDDNYNDDESDNVREDARQIVSADMKNELTDFFKKKVRDVRDSTYISEL
jgi:hypothetical protein